MSQKDEQTGSFRLFAPTEQVSTDEGRDLRLLARLMPYFRPHMTLLVTAFLLMPIASGAALLQPYFVKRAIDVVLIDRTSAALAAIVGYFAAAIIVGFLSTFALMYLMQLGGQRTTADLRRAVFVHIQRLPLSYFDRTPVGRVVTRVTNDIDSLTELFSSGAVTAVADFLTLVGIVVFMFYLDVELTLVTLAVMPFLALVVAIFRRYARDAFRQIRLRIAELNAYLAEQVQGIMVVQAFGREADCAEEYRLINQAYRDANLRAIRFDALLFSVVEAVSAAAVALVLYFAAIEAGLMTDTVASAAYVGTVVAFYEYIHRFFAPIRDLSTKYTIIQHSLASAERIFSILDEPLERERPPHMHAEEDQQTRDEAAATAEGTEPPEIELQGVSFGYRSGMPVLRDLTIAVSRGEHVALVGATGSGKTTITSLLQRLYETDEGTIRVHGRDIRDMPRNELRRLFAVVPQDVFLFAGSVVENIAIGDTTPDLGRVREALRRVGALDLVQERGGLDARVDERGANFSAGERQLLAFARALYLDRPILILDEATANVDSESEARLQRALGSLLEGRTALVIAHRLSTIEGSDRIVVLHRGRLCEEGRHDELLRAGGIYARLHRLHFEAAAAQ